MNTAADLVQAKTARPMAKVHLKNLSVVISTPPSHNGSTAKFYLLTAISAMWFNLDDCFVCAFWINMYVGMNTWKEPIHSFPSVGPGRNMKHIPTRMYIHHHTSYMHVNIHANINKSIHLRLDACPNLRSRVQMFQGLTGNWIPAAALCIGFGLVDLPNLSVFNGVYVSAACQ